MKIEDFPMFLLQELLLGNADIEDPFYICHYDRQSIHDLNILYQIAMDVDIWFFPPEFFNKEFTIFDEVIVFSVFD